MRGSDPSIPLSILVPERFRSTCTTAGNPTYPVSGVGAQGTCMIAGVPIPHQDMTASPQTLLRSRCRMTGSSSEAGVMGCKCLCMSRMRVNTMIGEPSGPYLVLTAGIMLKLGLGLV